MPGETRDPHIAAGPAEEIPPGFAAQRFSSDQLPQRDRFPFWKETICDVFANLEIAQASDHPFRAAIDWQSCDVGGGDSAVWTAINAVPLRARHEARHIARESRHYIGLYLLTQGRAHLTHASRSCAIGAGDMFLVDTTRPGAVELHDPYRQTGFKIPYERLASRLPRVPTWLGRAVSARTPLGRVLTAELAALAAEIGQVSVLVRSRLIDRAVELIALTFAQDLSQFAGCGSTVRRAHLMRARQYIDAHLADPELSVARVAAALGISTSYLHHLFKSADMAVADEIRRRRLERCRDDLASPLHAGEQIAEIALRWGFRDMPNFSRAFRRAFGLPPRDHRATAAERRTRSAT
jgi:AraC-like DNA-binding protein